MKKIMAAPTSEIDKLVSEYKKLISREQLSEDEADRMEEILESAGNDPVLDFWLTEADHHLGHQLGLLDEQSRNFYKDQQALLREYLEAWNSGSDNNSSITVGTV